MEIYDPKNPDLYKQVEIQPQPLPPLNIVPINSTQSTLKDGDFASRNFRFSRSGWRLRDDGTLEAREGVFSGQFNIGGTILTISSVLDIQESLNLVENAGGGIVYLQNGTYYLTSDITIPSGVTLQGVSRDAVVIDCNSSYSVKIVGSDTYSTGTISINNGDTTVVGSATTFTSAMVGQYIFLDGLWYEITAFTDTTHITITTYEGVNLSPGSAYLIATVNFTGSISRLTITNSSASGLVVQYAQEPHIDDIYVFNCAIGIEMDYVVYPRILVTSNENGSNMNLNYTFGFTLDFSDLSFSTSGAGLTMTNSGNANIYSSSMTDNTGDGISMTSCTKIPIIGCDVSGNGGQGIEMVSGCNDNQIIGGTFDGNTSDGIKLTASSDRNTISSVSILNNGGYGINIAASTCDGTQIIAPAFTSNTSGNINNSGTSTTIIPFTDVQTFTSSGTWTKPPNASITIIQLWAGGGSGGSGTGIGGGGGGGAYNTITKLTSDLSSTETVTIGAGGTAVTNSIGNAGGNSSFGSHLTVYGGGAGGVVSGGGGGGGGLTSAGSNGGTNGGNGGNISGGTGGNGANGGSSVFGGGGGGDGGGFSGGESYSGGGGGAGERGGSSNVKGGNSYFGGAGGGGGDNTGGTNNIGGTSILGGNGGAGNTGSANATAGSVPGGGGGGQNVNTFASGAGGDGKAIIISY